MKALVSFVRALRDCTHLNRSVVILRTAGQREQLRVCRSCGAIRIADERWETPLLVQDAIDHAERSL